MKKSIVFVIVSLLLVNCSEKSSKKSETELKNEIIKTEKEFENYCKINGIANGFYAFADSSAVIKLANDSLIKGKNNIKNHFDKSVSKSAKVTWNADFVDVSNDGTLAYTYGKYIWSVTDSLGNKKDFKGVFHTVWKRQKDDSWKYVWD